MIFYMPRIDWYQRCGNGPTSDGWAYVGTTGNPYAPAPPAPPRSLAVSHQQETKP